MNSFALKRFSNEFRTSKSGEDLVSFAILDKNYKCVDDLLDRRWRIYTDINYHHKVYKHEVLMVDCIYELGAKYLLDVSCGNEPPNDNYTLPFGIEGLWRIIEMINDDYIETASPEYLEDYVIQLDDGWVDTFLKRMYTEQKLLHIKPSSLFEYELRALTTKKMISNR